MAAIEHRQRPLKSLMIYAAAAAAAITATLRKARRRYARHFTEVSIEHIVLWPVGIWRDMPWRSRLATRHH